MGIQALYRRPNTSKPAPSHKVYPSLRRKLAVTRPNQVWAMDITYIPMARGFVYLVAVLDWFSRKVLAWRRSTTLETGPCIEALKEAMRHHSKPEIMNTDQGSQFTSIDFIKALKDADIQISMDGKGPVPFLCRPKCSFRPLSVRMRQGFSSPMLSASGADCRSR